MQGILNYGADLSVPIPSIQTATLESIPSKRKAFNIKIKNYIRPNILLYILHFCVYVCRMCLSGQKDLQAKCKQDTACKAKIIRFNIGTLLWQKTRMSNEASNHWAHLPIHLHAWPRHDRDAQYDWSVDTAWAGTSVRSKDDVQK